MANDTILDREALLSQAVGLHEAGRHAEAEPLYRRLLEGDGGDGAAHQGLGRLLLATGRALQATPHLAAALEADPEVAQRWLDYVLSLREAGFPDAAWIVLLQGKRLGLQGQAVDEVEAGLAAAAPATTDLEALFSQGRYGAVEAGAHVALLERPDHAGLWAIRGAALYQLGRSAEALQAMRRSVELAPERPELSLNLALLLSELQRHAEAETVLRDGLARTPDHLPSLGKLGAVLNDLARPAEARAVLEPLAARLPEEPTVWNNLGNSHLLMNQIGLAEAAYRRSLQLDADNAAVHSNIGNVFAVTGRFAEAEGAYRRAIELAPALADPHSNLADALRSQGRLVEAKQEIERALSLNPALATAHQVKGALSSYLSEHSDVVAESDAALALAPEAPAIWEMRLYTFSYHPDLTAEAIFQEFVRWGDRFPDPVTDFSGHDLAPARRLKIGYVSPDFRKHTSRFYFMPLMANHDRQAFETFAYSNVLVEDEHTQAFKAIFDHWRPIRGVSDMDVAEMVRRDGIDILVDCCNHMRDDRLDVFALKPAPIQVTWLGAAWTTGLKAIDYVLFDPYLAPEGTLAREEIVHLPGCFICYRPPDATAEVGPLPALRNGHVTFAYSGRTERLNHKTFRVWGEILRRTPGSKLVLDYHAFADPPTQAHYRELMARHGLDPERVVMRRSPDIFAGLNEFDIVLDSFPHSGGTMLFDALWMGVPCLTLKARPPLGRIGTSFVSNLGMEDWVAETEQDYIDKAVRFASDLPALARTRETLRQRMQASPLMDERAFARGVEQAYHDMWARLTSAAPDQPAGQASREPVLDLQSGLERLGALYQASRLDEMAVLARSIVGRYPDHPGGWKALAVALHGLGRLQEALNVQQTIVERLPGDCEALNNLGVIYTDLGDPASAEASFREALRIAPDYGQAHFNLAEAFRKAYRLIDSNRHFAEAMRLLPGTPLVEQNYATSFALLSDYAHVPTGAPAPPPTAAKLREIWEMRLYTLSYHPDLSAEAIFQEFVDWGDRFPEPAADFSGHDRTPARRLKVGYVSPDFRKHTSRFFFMPLMAHHDHQAFETFAYSNVLRPDEATEAFQGVFDHWRDIRPLSAEDAARLIREDGIDILVDCCSHMLDERLDVFVLKPAPIQVTWLGAAWTTGLKAIDYVLFDPYLAPEGTLAREEIVRLPHCFVAYRPPEGTPDLAPLPALRNGYLTFGYTGRTERLNHHTFRVWGEILRRVPGARLILDYHPFEDPPTQAHYRRLMAEHGLDPDRVEMRRSPRIFEGLNDIDIVLDCFPHSGGTMMYDAIWMGVPVLSLKGRPPLGRLGTTLMSNLGLAEWSADSEADYIDKAVRFAADLPGLAELRAGFRERIAASPLTDEVGFAKGVEEAYRAMWARWVAKA